MSRLGLVANAKIDFTLNTAEGTAEKQHLVFEKVKITVGKYGVHLPAIVVDGGHFDMLLGVNQIKKNGTKLDFKSDQVNVDDKIIPMKPYPHPGTHFLDIEICVESSENLVIESEALVEV